MFVKMIRHGLTSASPIIIQSIVDLLIIMNYELIIMN